MKSSQTGLHIISCRRSSTCVFNWKLPCLSVCSKLILREIMLLRNNKRNFILFRKKYVLADKLSYLIYR